MSQQPARRFEVLVEEGASHGDLYELEQTTYYRVMDTRSQEIILTFEGEMSASLSRSNAQWEDFQYGGVCQVSIAPDERSVLVNYYGGREETVLIPE
jgi:hypothetical protein